MEKSKSTPMTLKVVHNILKSKKGKLQKWIHI